MVEIGICLLKNEEEMRLQGKQHALPKNQREKRKQT